MSATPQHGEFAAWLRTKMAERRLNASGLARQIWGTTKDSRGYDVARNRDRVGHYLAGTSYPSLQTLYKIGEVLAVFPDDIPGGASRGALPDEPSIHRKLDRILDLLADKPAKEKTR
jgi:transcriptional regulator with XRE-family HTH domain